MMHSVFNKVWSPSNELVVGQFSVCPEVDTISGHGPSSDGYDSDGYTSFGDVNFYRRDKGRFVVEFGQRMPTGTVMQATIRPRTAGERGLFVYVLQPAFDYVAADKDKTWASSGIAVSNGKQAHVLVCDSAGTCTDLSWGSRLDFIVFCNNSSAEAWE